MTANEAQRDAWNGDSGHRWVADADRRDRVLAPVSDALLTAAQLSSGEHVLDIGCGCGATTLAAARAVQPGTVTGCRRGALNKASRFSIMGWSLNPPAIDPGKIASDQPVLGGGDRNRTGVQGFAGPCLSHSATPPADGVPTVGFRADDGIRTRDPHLGKVMLYQLSHVRVLLGRSTAERAGRL